MDPSYFHVKLLKAYSVGYKKEVWVTEVPKHVLELIKKFRLATFSNV